MNKDDATEPRRPAAPGTEGRPEGAAFGDPAAAGTAAEAAPARAPTKDLNYWRERILSFCIGSGVLIGLIILPPSVWLAIEAGRIAVAILDSMAVAAGLVILIARRIPYRFRAAAALGLAYSVGIGVCLSFGLMSGGPAWLFFFAVLAAVLLGIQGAIAAFCLNIVSLAAIGWLISKGFLGPEMAFFKSPGHALVAGINYMLLNGVAVVSVAVLLRGLQEKAEQAENMAADLQRERKELIEAKQGLQAEVEHRKRTEAALRQSEERFREMAEYLPETIYEMDMDGRLTYVNKNAYERFGYTPEDLQNGLKAFDMIAPEDHSRAEANVKRILAGEKIGITEYTAIRKDGGRFPAIFHSAVVFRGQTPGGLRGFVIDVTEKKRLEDQSFQAQRLESIGTLAGGIAHDFNNLLMGIQGRASILMADTDPSQPGYRNLKGIEEHVASAAHLTNQLLGFARAGKYEVRVTDPNLLVEKTLDMFGRTRKELRIFRRLERGLPGVEVDRGQIEQVLLNLFVNAWQAMDGGGQLYIETAAAAAADLPGLPHADSTAPFVRISVTDTGEGMDRTTRERVFEPFFTTRERGRGTGLGLATAYGIVRNHGGTVQVLSEPGRGATFHVYLPAVETPVEPEAADAPGGQPGGAETVLLVDDEEMVRDVGRQMLEKLGYTVQTAAGGRQALEMLQRPENGVELVILDMVMPEMGGKEVFERMKALSTPVRVLLSSGYSLDGQASEILRQGCDGFIQKPFSLGELAQKTREVLEGP